MKNFLPFLPLLLIVSVAGAQNMGNINLRTGDKFLVDSKVTAVTTQTLMGQSIESNAELTTKYSIGVKGIRENNYALVNTFTKMKANVSAMGNIINFDSEKKEDMAGEYAASFKEMINNPRELVMDKYGKIIDFKQAIKPSNTQTDIMKMMIDQLLGDPAETGYGVNLAFVSLPDKIIPGLNWADSSSMDGIRRSTTYTVKEIKGNDAVITITGTLNTDAISQMQGMDIITRSKGNLNGEEILDITSGVIKQRTTTLESSGIILIKAQGIEIPMTTRVTFTSAVNPA